MLGAIYTGLSGMEAFSQGLQAIGNNVSNLNTAGFKASVLEFSNQSFYGNNSSGDSGGNNLVGTGVSYVTPHIDFSQGTMQTTTSGLDLALQGDGFLVEKDGSKYLYARTGSFAVNNNGEIVDQRSGYQLVLLGTNGQLIGATIAGNKLSSPSPTSTVTFSGNLSSAATSDTVSSINVYDSAGNAHTWSIAFAPASAATGSTGTGTTTGTTTAGQWTLTITDETGATIATKTLSFTGNSPDPSTNKISVAYTPSGAAAQNVTLDFSSNVTSYSAGTTSTLQVASSDGYAAGTESSVSVDSNGAMQITYSNQQTKSLGNVAIASFYNPQDLSERSNGLFENVHSLQPRLLSSGEEGVGTIATKSIEASNVDLSGEFGDLILVQRGFQASSQVVTVANDMIQQLFGIRGQG